MDLINFQAGEIFEEINNEGMSYEHALNFIRGKSELYQNKEWLNLLINLRARYQETYDEHLKVCRAEIPTDCATNKWHIQLLYFLNEDIKSLEQEIATTVPGDSDFSPEDRQKTNLQVDAILAELEKLKMGQEIIWTDVMNELNELKEMYYLNKKTWRQLLTGKLTEMVSAGVISETISKGIVEAINPVADKLLS